MGTGQTDIKGPDLTQGIPLSRLADGEMLVGHVLDEQVLLARRGHEVFAIGANCTHYGGPLGEGLLVDDTVRCPWHHACFSLRTGEALRAPALNPVSCWRVDRRGEKVYVAEKREVAHKKPDPRGPIQTPDGGKGTNSIVIVGAGAAGHAAAEMLRHEGFNGQITLISADDAAPYDRPNLSKDFLAGTAPEEWIPLRPTSFYEEHDIALLLDKRVTQVDPGASNVVTASGETLRYDRLLLATGAAPIRLSIPGADLSHVYYLRTLADCRAIRDRSKARSAVVVGAGFIGMEVAASLRARGIDVHVVAPASYPMERVLGPEMGRMIRTLHEEHGVIFHLERTVTSISPRSVMLSNGDEVAADMVIIGIGVRPLTTLAEQAGLQVENGVLVDAYLETSHAGIFAAGDIASWLDKRSNQRIRVEHWVVAQRQGQVAARNMLGRRAPFDAVPFFWTQHYDLPIAYVGHAAQWGRTEVVGSIDERDCVVAYKQGEQILAVASIHRDRESLTAEAAMERFDEETLGSLFH